MEPFPLACILQGGPQKPGINGVSYGAPRSRVNDYFSQPQWSIYFRPFIGAPYLHLTIRIDGPLRRRGGFFFPSNNLRSWLHWMKLSVLPRKIKPNDSWRPSGHQTLWNMLHSKAGKECVFFVFLLGGLRCFFFAGREDDGLIWWMLEDIYTFVG